MAATSSTSSNVIGLIGTNYNPMTQMVLFGIKPKLHMDSFGNLCPSKSPPLAIPGQNPTKILRAIKLI